MAGRADARLDMSLNWPGILPAGPQQGKNSEGRNDMARVAVVTGGTRGIGHAISMALKTRVTASPPTTPATMPPRSKFQAETGIPVYKWDVGDYAACQEGVTQIAKRSRARRRARQQRRHHARRHAPQHDQGAVGRGDPTNLNSVFNMTRPVIEGMRARKLRAHHQHLLDQRPQGPDGPGQLFGRQGGHARLHQGAGPGRRRARASPSTPSRPATSPPRW